MFCGSQADKNFLNEVQTEIGGKFDIIIDDGSHQMQHQMASLYLLFNAIKPGGIYVVEDLHTSYWSGFGGQYHGNTTMELLKECTDNLNAIQTTFDCIPSETQYIQTRDSDNPFEKSKVDEHITNMNAKLSFIHFYPSVAILGIK